MSFELLNSSESDSESYPKLIGIDPADVHLQTATVASKQQMNQRNMMKRQPVKSGFIPVRPTILSTSVRLAPVRTSVPRTLMPSVSVRILNPQLRMQTLAQLPSTSAGIYNKQDV